jgi:hypothetical protein
MQRAAERQLRLLVEDMNSRYEVLDADAEVTRHLVADVVIDEFRAWLNLTPNRVMREALAWDSLTELWNAFELECRHLSLGQFDGCRAARVGAPRQWGSRGATEQDPASHLPQGRPALAPAAEARASDRRRGVSLRCEI